MKNNDIKIIFVDIDQTILWHRPKDSVFDMKSIRGLKKAQKRGVKVVLSTARPYDSALHTGVLDTIKPDGMVCSTGTFSFIDGEVVHSDCFSEKQVDSVLAACNELNIVCQIATEYERFYTREPDDYVRGYYKVYREKYGPIRNDFKGERVTALLVFSPIKLDRKFTKLIDPSLFFYRFTEFGIDLKTHDVSKKEGMLPIMEKLGLKSKNAMAVGDETYDSMMYDLCDYKVAMGNGTDALKAKATYVTKPIEKHGVYYALKHYHII